VFTLGRCQRKRLNSGVKFAIRTSFIEFVHLLSFHNYLSQTIQTIFSVLFVTTVFSIDMIYNGLLHRNR
jgi:hypothetical protein